LERAAESTAIGGPLMAPDGDWLILGEHLIRSFPASGQLLNWHALRLSLWKERFFEEAEEKPR
jgi:hypothetical protein